MNGLNVIVPLFAVKSEPAIAVSFAVEKLTVTAVCDGLLSWTTKTCVEVPALPSTRLASAIVIDGIRSSLTMVAVAVPVPMVAPCSPESWMSNVSSVSKTSSAVVSRVALTDVSPGAIDRLPVTAG